MGAPVVSTTGAFRFGGNVLSAPAKAGVQGYGAHRLRPWAPAFAGALDYSFGCPSGFHCGLALPFARLRMGFTSERIARVMKSMSSASSVSLG